MYTRTSNGEALSVLSSDSRVQCGDESGGRYRCVLAPSLMSFGVSYIFEVAGRNRYGYGPFSDPVIGRRALPGMKQWDSSRQASLIYDTVTLKFSDLACERHIQTTAEPNVVTERPKTTGTYLYGDTTTTGSSQTMTVHTTSEYRQTTEDDMSQKVTRQFSESLSETTEVMKPELTSDINEATTVPQLATNRETSSPGIVVSTLGLNPNSLGRE